MPRTRVTLVERKDPDAGPPLSLNNCRERVTTVSKKRATSQIFSNFAKKSYVGRGSWLVAQGVTLVLSQSVTQRGKLGARYIQVGFQDLMYIPTPFRVRVPLKVRLQSVVSYKYPGSPSALHASPPNPAPYFPPSPMLAAVHSHHWRTYEEFYARITSYPVLELKMCRARCIPTVLIP
jgi:hypothetical protein